MNNLIWYKGVYITKEQYDDIMNMPQLSDDEIDLSDIPEITHEEFVRAIENRRKRLQRANALKQAV
jgi:hypothetical protein